ncbi:MAG: FIVAR domain-containing protein, partial [Bifidobacteriaceae bacterium]|jgi:hypothetical protein|nr:FIVAR domain-containing protein [Bifidobacteriaceae bacterium]
VGKAAYTAVIDWADGSGPEAAVIDGANAATNRGPTLFTVSGSHTYEPGSVYTGTVTFVEGANTYPLPFQVVVAADKAALVAAVNDAEQLDPSDYTPESWVGFEAALNAARGVLADAAATQGAVGGAVSALASATDDLVEVAASLDLSVSVVPRCMGGKAYLNTSVKNNGDPTADISTVTPYGSKASAGVTSGRAASGSFNSRLVSIPAGLVTVQAVSAQDDAEFLDTIAYAALDCG